MIIDRAEKFTIIGNTILQDPSISLKSKGIASLLFSLGDGWEFSVERLMAYSKDGRDAVRAALLELETHGYLRREQNRARGKFGDSDYILSENSMLSEPMSENPTSGNPTTYKTTIYKTPLNKTTNIEESSLHSDSSFCPDAGNPASGQKEGGGDVFIELPLIGGKIAKVPESYVAQLQELYQAIDVHEEIRKAKAWLISNPKNGKKDWKRFLNGWLSRAQDKAPTSQPSLPARRHQGNLGRDYNPHNDFSDVKATKYEI